MLARFGKIFVVAALVVTTGAHWAALQTVAWTTMLANHLCTQSVSQAVAQTFDGDHLCPLCRAIAAAKKAEKKSEAVAPEFKLEFLSGTEKIILFPPAQFELLPQSHFFTKNFFPKPPLQPPRRFFV